MVIQILHSFLQSPFNFCRGFIIGIMECRLFESGEIRFHQFQPRTVGWQPMELDPLGMLRRPFRDRRCLMSLQIVEDEMNASPPPSFQNDLLQEIAAIWTAFAGCPASNGFPGLGKKAAKNCRVPCVRL